jgi:hypothetical protein
LLRLDGGELGAGDRYDSECSKQIERSLHGPSFFDAQEKLYHMKEHAAAVPDPSIAPAWLLSARDHGRAGRGEVQSSPPERYLAPGW